MLEIGEGSDYMLLDLDFVFDVFCLPREIGCDVMETSRAPKHPNREIYAQWKVWFDIEGDNTIPLHLLYNAMCAEISEGKDDFKKFFIVYMFGTVFSPVSNCSVGCEGFENC